MTSFEVCWPMSSPTTMSGTLAKAQALGTGLGVGMIILDQIFPGSGRITPIAGALVTSSYSRTEEYAADHHGMEILTRAGLSQERHGRYADVARANGGRKAAAASSRAIRGPRTVSTH